MPDKKKLAIIGVASGQEALYRVAKENDIQTVGFGWPEGAKCADLADVYYPVSILDTDKVVELCQKEMIDGVVSNASSLTARVVAEVSERLNLPGNTPNAIETALDKFAVRRLTADIPGLRNVRYELLTDTAGMTSLDFPVVVKPTGGAGKNGVSFVKESDGFDTAVQYARKSECGEILVEEYISGREISVESISCEGRHRVLQITDKETTGAPHFIEIAHHQPASLPLEIMEKIERMVEQILDKIGFTSGASHIELKITDSGEICLIEVNPRGGGDEISNRLTKLSTDIDYVRLMIDIALGKGRLPEKSEIRHDMFSGIYFLCAQTARLLKYFDDKKYEWMIERVRLTTGTRLMESKGNYERDGYIIYKSSKPLVL